MFDLNSYFGLKCNTSHMCLLYDLFKAQYLMFVVTSTGSISQVGLDGRKAADTGLSRARGPRNQIKKEFVKFSIK